MVICSLVRSRLSSRREGREGKGELSVISGERGLAATGCSW
jgi:hypothetical protein